MWMRTKFDLIDTSIIDVQVQICMTLTGIIVSQLPTGHSGVRKVEEEIHDSTPGLIQTDLQSSLQIAHKPDASLITRY